MGQNAKLLRQLQLFQPSGLLRFLQWTSLDHNRELSHETSLSLLLLTSTVIWLAPFRYALYITDLRHSHLFKPLGKPLWNSKYYPFWQQRTICQPTYHFSMQISWDYLSNDDCVQSADNWTSGTVQKDACITTFTTQGRNPKVIGAYLCIRRLTLTITNLIAPPMSPLFSWHIRSTHLAQW